MPVKKISISPFLYIPFVLGLTWLPWLLAISTGQGVENLAVKVLLLAGLLVPALLAVVFLLLSGESEENWDYWRRIFDPTLISRRGYREIFLIPLFIAVTAILVAWALGQPLSQLKLVSQVKAHLPSILIFIFYTFFVGPFPEELGWRGYWLDKLKNIMSGFRASLLIAVVWAIWTIPLFLVKGYPLQARTGHDWLVAFYFLQLFPKSVIFTYIFYRNKKSTLAAILFHFMINFVDQLFELSALTEGIQTLLYLIVATIVILRNRDIFKQKTSEKQLASL
ncbi:MAG: type II CAAX endopeptidase family protein [Acidobacteriota bacterium]|nr:type II CAAX endopeptidase family protein [Acidobacteriota bacterium]